MRNGERSGIALTLDFTVESNDFTPRIGLSVSQENISKRTDARTPPTGGPHPEGGAVELYFLFI